MLKYILLGLAGIICAFLIVASLQPADFRVSRSATIAAPPAVVFEQVNDLTKWNAWSPWAKLDPNAKNTFEGPPAGVGASFAWDGNNEVGAGRMTITESRPGELVAMKLDFTKPFTASNLTEFSFKPEGNQTAVTWTMSGKNGLIGKCMHLVVDCDKMMGSQFEKGFENLKAIVEKAPQS